MILDKCSSAAMHIAYAIKITNEKFTIYDKLARLGGLQVTSMSTRAQHFPSNLYPYPDHNHQQRPMPTHAIQIASMYSKIV